MRGFRDTLARRQRSVAIGRAHTVKMWYAALAGVVGFVALMMVTVLAGDGSSSTTASSASSSSSAASPVTAEFQVSPTLAPPADSERASVTRIVDGDTIEVKMLSGETATVRLIGINTPESGECFSEESTVALGTLLSDEVVTMTADVSDRDQYGRLLMYLWLDRGVFVNEIMVRGGYAQARDYPPDSLYAEAFAAAQESAQADAIGIWAEDACGLSMGVDVRVIDVLPDPEGFDNDNLEGEWVDIVNAGPTDVAMRGWVLKDESSSHRFPFPDGFVLAPRATVRVRTGCGTDDDETLHWCNGSPVWNNSGDTAFLLDSNGNVVSFFRY